MRAPQRPRPTQRVNIAPLILQSQSYTERPYSLEAPPSEVSVEDKEEPALRLRTEQEEHIVKPLGGGSFFEYCLLVLVKVAKSSRLTPILAYTFPKARLSLSVIYNREVLYKINKALQQKFASHTF